MSRLSAPSDSHIPDSFAKTAHDFSRRVRARSMTRSFAYGMAMLAAIAVILATETLLYLRSTEMVAERKAATQAFAAELRARCDRELNSVLYLASGLTGYLVVRHNNLDPTEINRILAAVYEYARHVRNFTIAEGYRINYVYPRQGNESAIGVDYRRMNAQWPSVKRAVDSRKVVLTGPVNLIQGGVGLIYRSPIFVDDAYWGMLSTVVDIPSLINAVTSEVDGHDYDYAIRTNEINVASGGLLMGNAELFADPSAVQIEAKLADGSWTYAVRARHHGRTALFWAARGIAWILAILTGFFVQTILRQRYELAHLAGYDALTGLPNRRLFDDRLEQAIYRRDRTEDQQLAVLFVDLNDFKPVNDRFGHRVGDEVLRKTATRLRDEIRIGDTVARWAGDEFIILLDGTTREQTSLLVERLQQRIAEPFSAREMPFSVSAAIGVAFCPGDAVTAAELLSIADQRMYDNKRHRHPGNHPA